MGNTFTEHLPRSVIDKDDYFEDHCDYMREWSTFLAQQGAQAPGTIIGGDNVEFTLLHLKSGDTSIQGVYMLVLCGADVNAVTTYGETPLALMLRVERNNDSHLFREQLRFLLANGANPLTIDKLGLTPTSNAFQSHLWDLWLEVLSEVGHDAREIVRQSITLMQEWHVKEFRGAVSSAVDNAIFENQPERRRPFADNEKFDE